MRIPKASVAIALLLLPAALGVAACGDDDEAARTTASGSDETKPSAPVISAELPFGLEDVEGAVAIGRPAVYESDSDQAAESSVVFKAAFRIDADDPVAAFDAWVAQLEQAEGLSLGEIHLRGGEDDDAWLTASADSRDYADLQLWTTADEPVLLVHITRRPGDGEATSRTNEVEAGSPPESSVEWAERRDGDVMFTEQGSSIHFPAGTTSLMPTLPVFAGTGGSFSVVSAEDAAAAVQALLDEAMATSTSGQIPVHDELEHEGAAIIRASFVIMAGGWGFDVVSIEAPDDPFATLYVSTFAD